MNNQPEAYSEKDLDFLLSPLAIRKSAEALFELSQKGGTHLFIIQKI